MGGSTITTPFHYLPQHERGPDRVVERSSIPTPVPPAQAASLPMAVMSVWALIRRPKSSTVASTHVQSFKEVVAPLTEIFVQKLDYGKPNISLTYPLHTGCIVLILFLNNYLHYYGV